MPPSDQIVALTVLCGNGAVLAFRAWRAWREYRIQRKTLDLLVEAMSEVDDPKQQITRR